MADGEDNNRIKFAYYLHGWQYEGGNQRFLRDNAVEVPPSDYTDEMKGHIFCPECCVSLFRSPEKEAYSKAGKKAYFAHSRTHRPLCNLRVKSKEGKRYENEEEAKQAIEDGELVCVKGFLESRPVAPDLDAPREYDDGPVEGDDGELAEVPIGRHNSEKFQLPSRVATVRGICRRFDKNLYKYFYLPGLLCAVQLSELLTNIESVEEENPTPKLYFGRITKSWNCGKTPRNVRQTMLKYTPRPGVKDFCLKAIDQDCHEHGINDESDGRVVIIYGKVTESGLGLCIEKVGWGEFALLPDNYVNLLELDT